MIPIRFLYIFDPLCGWCYASSAALDTLAKTWPSLLEMHPSGLFSGSGARQLSADWAAHAWSNDQRIAAATGEVFSEAYHDKVLMDRITPFDSSAINQVLTLVQQIDKALEPHLLRQLQLARYVVGENTSTPQVVAQVTARVLADTGHTSDATALYQRLSGDSELSRQTDARISTTQRLMSKYGIRGVPQLLVEVDGKIHGISSDALYQGRAALLDELRNVTGGALD